jgi:hypothetical protein
MEENAMTTQRVRKYLGAAMLAGILSVIGCAESGHEITVERSTVNGLPSVVATEKMSGEVKVEAIDYDNRSIALEGSDGNCEIFKLSPAVRNFNQIKKGDTVKVEYQTTVDVNVRKVGEPLAATEVVGVARAPLGEKPGLIAVRTVEVLANVEAIDYTERTVTLVGMRDKPVTIHVSPKLKSFDKVAKGDQVIFTYTESVSIEVKK